jgi:hypothetical protein
VSILKPEQLEGGESFEALVDARVTLKAYQAFLEQPGFVHNIDVAVLTKIAANDKLPPREQRRAAEMMATLRLKALDCVAQLTGAREQILKALGLDIATMKALAITQVNTSVQVDARRITVEADRETLTRLLADPAAADLAAALARRLDGGPRLDGAPPDEGAVPDPAPPGPALEGDQQDGEGRGPAPGADAPAVREERDVQRVDSGLAAQRLAPQEDHPG